MTEEQLSYEFMSKVPKSWKGPAYLCPEGHQMHELNFDYCKYWYKDTHCNSCGWIKQELFKLDTEIKKRTEGRKATETEIEDEPRGE